MITFVLHRLWQAIVVMAVVALLAFTMFRFVGDPVNQMVGIETTPEQREIIRESLGLNDAVIVQFWSFIKGAVQFEFGISYQWKKSVSDMIFSRLPATMELSLVSAVFSLIIAIPMGVYTGLNRNSVLSKFFLSISLIGVSLPTFLIGILLIYLFAVQLHMLPSFGRGEIVDVGGWTTGFLTVSGWKSLILPAFTLGLFQMTLIMRLVRSEMLEVLRTDYIKFARARGLPSRIVNFGHALKNTLIPVITITGLQLGSLIAFAIITETVFQWPGMGFLFVEAVRDVDIPIMSAYLLLIAFLFVTINLVVDILYFVVDPRLRVSGKE
ncbi:MAG: ABC transporter permease [Cohaesibacteraceae bacterium]|nr:ABC transporter permease [Cohaesibacteraceae bacterium]